MKNLMNRPICVLIKVPSSQTVSQPHHWSTHPSGRREDGSTYFWLYLLASWLRCWLGSRTECHGVRNKEGNWSDCDSAVASGATFYVMTKFPFPVRCSQCSFWSGNQEVILSQRLERSWGFQTGRQWRKKLRDLKPYNFVSNTFKAQFS